MRNFVTSGAALNRVKTPILANPGGSSGVLARSVVRRAWLPIQEQACDGRVAASLVVPVAAPPWSARRTFTHRRRPGGGRHVQDGQASQLLRVLRATGGGRQQ